MPRGVHPRSTKIDWSDADAKRAYIAAYRRERRKAGIEPQHYHNGYRRKVVKVEGKRDIFEVAAMLAKALSNVERKVEIEFGPHKDIKAALAAYKEYWEQD